MKHASITKDKKSTYGAELYSDRRACMFASRAYHHAKQRGFLTGDDALKSLEAEKELNGSLGATIR